MLRLIIGRGVGTYSFWAEKNGQPQSEDKARSSPHGPFEECLLTRCSKWHIMRAWSVQSERRVLTLRCTTEHISPHLLRWLRSLFAATPPCPSSVQARDATPVCFGWTFQSCSSKESNTAQVAPVAQNSVYFNDSASKWDFLDLLFWSCSFT